MYHRTGPLSGEKWYKKRVWKTTSSMKKQVNTDARFDFTGSGRDLMQAAAKARGWVPHGYVDVDAREFLDNPERYGESGEWVEWQVVSE